MTRKIKAALVETLESRQLLSTALPSLRAAAHAVPVIGPSAGLTASANPSVDYIITNVQGESATGNSALTNVDRDTTVNFKVKLPAGGVSDSSLNANTSANSYNTAAIKIVQVSSGNAIAIYPVNTSGGGDTITIRPIVGQGQSAALLANTTYRVEVNTGVARAKDVSGNEFTPFMIEFTTGSYIKPGDPDIRFEKSIQVNKVSNENGSFTSVTIGPDQRLYAGTLQGYIYRYDIDATTGALSNETRIDAIRDNNGGARFITGITFDPRSNPIEPVLWVSHGQAKYGDTPQTFADNHTGKISRLYGANFSTYEDVIVNIPRSAKDHLNDQIAFDPAGKSLYFVIPSMSAMGAKDAVWGDREEEIASAAMVRLQLRSAGTRVGIEQWLSTAGPINLDPLSSRPYSFYKGNNPLRLYATGIRSAFDMVFHSNGHLYAPANGSAAGGNAPGTPADLADVPNNMRLDYNGTNPYSGPVVAPRVEIDQVIDDFLFDVKEGGYYGHPNPTRGEYVLNGGNTIPQGNTTVYDPSGYPKGTPADRNYRGVAYDFGKNISPDGVIEYKSKAFGGALQGDLLVARYNTGSDIVALKPKSNGTFDQNTAASLGIDGLTNLNRPLDLVEDTRNGNIYTVSLTSRTSGAGTITLSRPLTGRLDADTPRVGLYAVPGDRNGATKTVTFTNNTTASVFIDPKLIRLTGRDRKSFVVTNLQDSYEPVGRNESVTFDVKFVGRAGDTAPKAGNLAIPLGAVSGSYTTIQIRGFAQTASTPRVAKVPAAVKAKSPFSIKTIGDTGGSTASARGVLDVAQRQMYFNTVIGTADTQILRITNTGDGNLTLRPGSVYTRGGDRKDFALLNFPAEGVSIKPGRRFDLQIAFAPRTSGDYTVQVARVVIASNVGAFSTDLRGLPTAGIGMDKEPSLQQVFNTFGFQGINDGDTTPLEYQLGTPSSDSTEVNVQTLVKAGNGPVIIRPLAVFGTDNGPAVRVGTYTPGQADSDQPLWYVPRESAQSVNPIVYGQTVIDPGSKEFGLFGEFPGFVNEDGGDRLVYSEDKLNSIWEPNVAQQRKVRFYPYIDQNGTAVPNAYIVAMEEYTLNVDNQDVVFVITNVKPANENKPTLAVTTTAAIPDNHTMVFNAIENSDPDYPNTTRLTNTATVRNTGTQNLVVSFNTSGDFSIISNGGQGVIIPPGVERKVVVKFVGNTTGVKTGNFTITSNDPTQPTTTIKLTGWWQEYSEFRPENHGISLEPTAKEVVNDLFGFTTKLTNSGQSLNQNGNVVATGDEVLSPYWQVADDNAQVRVTQLAAYHNQTYQDPNGNPLPTATFLQWFTQGDRAHPKFVGGLTHHIGDAQSILPRRNSPANQITAGGFQPGNLPFGLAVEGNETTDPALNSPDDPSKGSYVRFFPAKDADGVLIPNAYIVLHDYNRTFTNYDFNDNIYYITNIVPAGATKSPLTVFTEETSKGARIAFTSPTTGAYISGFNVYRSSSPDSGYTLLNTDGPLARRPITVFLDENSTASDTYWYRIVSVGRGGAVSQPVTVRI